MIAEQPELDVPVRQSLKKTLEVVRLVAPHGQMLRDTL